MWWLWTSYTFPFLPSSYFPQVTVTTSCHHVQKHVIALTSWKRQVTRKQRPGPKKNVTCPGNLGACWLPSEGFSWCPLQQNHCVSLICPCQDGLRTQWCGHEGERRKEEKEVLVIVAMFPVIFSFCSPTKNTGLQNWAQNCSKQPAFAPLWLRLCLVKAILSEHHRKGKANHNVELLQREFLSVCVGMLLGGFCDQHEKVHG